MAKKLEPGITAIGQIKGKDNKNMIRSFTILYGNLVDPPNEDGEIKSLKDSLYREKLNEFLESEEGKKYLIPSDEEIEQASIDMQNRIEAVKQQKEKEATQEIEVQAEQVNDVSKTVEPLKEEVVIETKEAVKPKNINKVLIGILSGLLVLSLIGNVIQLVTKSYSGKQTTLMVDEEVYKVPTEDLQVGAGESKIIIYGIGRSSDGNNIYTKLIPLGNFNLNEPLQSITETNKETETTEEEVTEETEPIEEKAEETKEEKKTN